LLRAKKDKTADETGKQKGPEYAAPLFALTAIAVHCSSGGPDETLEGVADDSASFSSAR
jgi:hypothetical protein